MNSWLRNIQGQLSELATEVLQEATTEVEDPETELQVEKKKCEEAERLLIVERSAAEALEQRVAELEHQLAFCNEENEAMKEKFERMISSRDAQIKNLQTEIHSAEFHRGDSSFQIIDLDERTYVSAKSNSSESACSTTDVILEEDISLLKEQLVASEENSAKLRLLLNEKEASLVEESKALSDLQQVLRKLGEDQAQETTALGSQIKALRKENEEIQTALNTLRERESSLVEDRRFFEDSVTLLKEELERKNAAIEELEKLRLEKEEVQRSLANSESVHEDYVKNIERLSSDLQSKHDYLNEAERELTCCREKLAIEHDEQEHLRKELSSLREHLSMEEISTREAVVAEEREAQLRDQIRTLQNHTAQFSESANQSQNQYLEEITLLKEQLVASEENSAKLRLLLNEKEASLVEESKALSDLQQVLRKLGEDQAQETTALGSQIKALRKENEEILTALNTLRERESSLVEDRRFFEDSVTLLKEELERKNAAIEELEKLRLEKEEVQRSLANSESVHEDYVKNIERLSSDLQSKHDYLNEAERELTCCREKLAIGHDEQEHLRKELSRLREHLFSMEEISTREAVVAEEREAQLRDQIRTLQNHTAQFSESANQSQNQYLEEISLLKEQLVASEENSAKLRSLLNEKEASLAEESKALSNLQQVLCELGEDQMQETIAFESQIKALRKENEEIKTALTTLRERESSLVEDRRFFEDSVTLLKEELERKNAAIEELENQMEELRHRWSSMRDGGHATTSQTLFASDGRPSSVGDSSDGGVRERSAVATYKIDDSTLKHLFFSYFIAEKEKQPEIAVVMASILGYSPEEQATIQDAVSANQSGGGWFFGMGGGGGKRGGRSHAPSLTEQFIRFLETESRALAEQPTLYIQGDSGSSPSSDGGQGSVMLTDVTQLPAASSISQHSNYSTSDLKSIIEP